MIETDIVIIDSGVNTSHKFFKNLSNDIIGINIYKNIFNESIETNESISDKIGHGTAITYIIKKRLKRCRIFMVKIFEEDLFTDLNLFEFALEYILDNINCKIVHISNGFTQWDNTNKIKDICYQLFLKGIIIVASFDNYGRISYPAFYPFVIGVDSSEKCRHIDEYIFIENENINIQSILFNQRLPWINNSTKEVSGTSFSSPYITCFVFNLIEKGVTRYEDILSGLKENAKSVIAKPSQLKSSDNKCFKITKAIMLPYNKEIVSMLRFANTLNFEIKDIYDIKYLRNIGKTSNGFIIKNYENIIWEDDFDTVIIGHMKDINDITNKNIVKKIVDKCIYNQKNIFSFDDISSYVYDIDTADYRGRIYFPHIDQRHVPANRFGKMFDIGAPVLGIFGTSSKQGKFTLQMELKNRFIDDGYHLGLIGTEPNALLCGFDYCYPIGYGSNIKLNSYEAILCLNNMVHQLEKNNVDIIITGSQSQSLHHNSGNIGMYPAYQYEFLCGTSPDAIILCVNYEDEDAYIKQTISFLESASYSPVIALALFPFKKYSEWSILSDSYMLIEDEHLQNRKKQLAKECEKKVFIVKNKFELDELFCDIISFFEER